MDNHTPAQRRRNMQAIRNKNTSIELLLRKELRSRGIRYRINCTGITGKPDIGFKGMKVAVFCDSEFWHGYDWEVQKDRIKSNREYWIPKIERNMERDREVNRMLESEGYAVLRFWGKEISADTSACADRIIEILNERRRRSGPVSQQ